MLRCARHSRCSAQSLLPTLMHALPSREQQSSPWSPWGWASWSLNLASSLLGTPENHSALSSALAKKQVSSERGNTKPGPERECERQENRQHSTSCQGIRAEGHLVRVFLDILDGLQDPQRLLYIPAEGQVVDSGVLDDALRTEVLISDT